ncbi:MAG: aldo/keto reductase, partial [Bacteroidaceae bacterium]|nr:aldo/keto reductase [Bacteroidaceae bacterium]
MAQKINRRRFLKLFGAGSDVLTASLYGCDNKAQKTVMKEKAPGDVPTDKMTYRVNPKTKDKISILGYGMMRLPNIEQKASKDGKPTESVIDQEQVNRLVKYALDHGVNYFDTSPAYCKGH